MRHALRSIARTAYAVAVAGALMFGGAHAVELGSQCDFDPPTYLGECLGATNCQRTCEFYQGWQGTCESDGCCYCAI